MISSSASFKKCFYIGNKVLGLEGLKRIKWMNPKAPPKEQYQPSYIEHIANIVTHAIWIFPSILGTVELYRRSQSNAQILSAMVYGLTLTTLFSVSTSFHCVFYCHTHRCLKDVLHRCDRAIIYVFIAGSYFPWLTMELSQQGWASHMRWVIWLMAVLGILYQQFFHEKYKKLEITFYLIMGICPVLPILITERYFLGMVELTVGGILYVAGVIFFKCDGVIPFAHAIWHLFVAMAAYSHYYAILNYLYPWIKQV